MADHPPGLAGPTDSDVLAVFAVFDAAGLRGPDVMRDPAKAGTVVAVWRAALADCDGRELVVAALAHVGSTDSSFYPPPGALRAHLDRPTSDDAWGSVMADVRAYGCERFPRDAHTEATLRAIEAVGGIDAIGRSRTDEHAALRAAFRRAWDAASRSAMSATLTAAAAQLQVTARPSLTDRGGR